jgi:uncharacterized protein (DUF1501 family)
MTMKRRTWLKLSGLLGTAAVPWLSSPGLAQTPGYAGPYWIFLTASGGWDPRFLFDPTTNIEQNRLYTEIGTRGNISYAPIDATPEEFGLEVAAGAELPYLNPERFLAKYGDRLTVFNGVDTGTNNHDAGQRAFTSGTNQDGVPALGALLAATHGLSQPLPFISFGGYDKTYDVAPLSRIGSSNVLSALAAPNIIYPTNMDSETYQTDDTWLRIRAAQSARLSELTGAQRLPRLQASQKALADARLTDMELRALQLPTLIDLPGGLDRAERTLRAGQLALAAFKAGLGVAANLEIGGFDTHGNHDTDQRRSLILMLTALGGILDQIDSLGMRDQVYVVVGSDFGRTPFYNGENTNSGKDHWAITSTLAMGPGIPGNRVIGGTTADQQARKIDPTTLMAADSGVPLTPGLIQAALRKRAGIDPALITRFPVLGDDLPLLG